MISAQNPLLFILFLTFFSTFSHSQTLDYGLVFIWNNSTQTYNDPTIPEDGTSQWNYLGTFGGGAYATKAISLRTAAQLDINYQQKGYKEIAQVGFIPGGPFSEMNLRNTFNYLSADLAIKHLLFHSPSIGTYIGLAVEYSYLLNYDIESDFFPINNFYPVNAYQDKWEKHNISLVPSISLTIDQAITLLFGFNRSLPPVLKAENLVVKDWIWTVRGSISIPSFFHKKE